MTDRMQDEFRQTGEVMTELLAKAGEARAAGRSRRDFFSTTAKIAGATALGAAGIGILQPIAARAQTAGPSSTDSVQDILNIAATAETLAICLYYHAIISPNLPSVHATANLNYFQAALSEEYEHLVFLNQNGAQALASSFYFPANMFTDEKVFYATTSTLEEYFISAYTVAALDFSGAYSSNITAASPTLIGAAVQIACVESEHRALLRVANNQNPPNNRVAEDILVTNVQAAATALGPFLTGASGFRGLYHTPGLANIVNVTKPYNPQRLKQPTYI